MNTYPDWGKKTASTKDDWRNLGSVFPNE
jgi:hypothetical protein